MTVSISHHQGAGRAGVDYCPGVDERGHGMRLALIHDAQCCQEWGSGQASTPARAAAFTDAAARWGDAWPRPEAGPSEPEAGQ